MGGQLADGGLSPGIGQLTPQRRSLSSTSFQLKLPHKASSPVSTISTTSSMHARSWEGFASPLATPNRSNSGSTEPSLTPRKRASPPSGGTTPPHKIQDFFSTSHYSSSDEPCHSNLNSGSYFSSAAEARPIPSTSASSSSLATPYVSRLSLHSNSSGSVAEDFKNAAISEDIGLKLPNRASSVPSAGIMSRNKCGMVRSARQASSDAFKSILPSELFQMMSADTSSSGPSTLLLLDIRPHSMYSLSQQGRLRDSINICVPSTLLRRPNYKIQKIADTIQSAAQSQRVAQAVEDSKDATLKALFVYDQNSTSLIVDHPLHSLLLKYQQEGFQGDLCWVQGGFEAISATSSLAPFLESGPISKSLDAPERSRSRSSSSSADGRSDSGDNMYFSEVEGRLGSNSSQTSLSSVDMGCANRSLTSSPEESSQNPILLCRALPMSAFDSRSTVQYQTSSSDSPRLAHSDNKDSTKAVASPDKVFSNPFYDSIRQNHENLSLKLSTSHLKPVSFPFDDQLARHKDRLPRFLRELVDLSPAERAHELASEFHEIEADEQSRMQQVMSWHSQQDKQSEYHPFSISAGVEKGHKNRYKYIFPFEHTRCHLQKKKPQDCDYINASHISFGNWSDKTYIATQAPVATSTSDFYQLAIQEGIAVVVMLCNLREGGQEKCYKYYSPGEYGAFTVASQKTSGCESPLDQDKAGSEFFSSFDVPVKGHKRKSADAPIRTRQLIVQDKRKPQTKPHKMLHVQYTAWPDFDTPPDADSVLELLALVNGANVQAAKMRGLNKPPPIFVHCSAGVGRTGCYMLMDVMLDLLRERQANVVRSTKMDVDMDAGSAVHQDAKALSVDTSMDLLAQEKPILTLVKHMREQRMSLVANLAQYTFCHEAILRAIVD